MQPLVLTPGVGMVVAKQEVKTAHAGTPGKVLISLSDDDPTALSPFEMLVGAYILMQQCNFPPCLFR